MATDATQPAAERVSTPALDALNFFLADVRDGLSPYLAIYLIAVRGPTHGWNEATVGVVLTISGLVGLLAQTPAGVLIDRATNKPRIIMAAAVLVTLSSVSLPIVSGYTLVVTTQSIAAAAGAVFAPAISAVTLGLVGPKLFTRRVGRNGIQSRRQRGLCSRCRHFSVEVWPGGRVLADGRIDDRQHRCGAADQKQ